MTGLVARTTNGVVNNTVLIDRFELAYRRLYRADADRIWVSGDGNPVITVDGFSGNDIAVYDVSNPLRPAAVSDLTVEASGPGYRVSFVPSGPAKT